MATKKKRAKKGSRRPKKKAAKRKAPKRAPKKASKRKRAGVVKRARIGQLKVEVRRTAGGFQSRVCTPIIGAGATPNEAVAAARKLLGGRSGSGGGNARELALRRRLGL